MLSKFFSTMIAFPKTLVIRHQRENLKKCSLSGLEAREDFHFLSYPLQSSYPFSGYLLLTLDQNVPPLSKKDYNFGLLLLDATWRLAKKMEENIPALSTLEKRSLPSGFLTAYPRRQQDCPDPLRGLSSLEAIAIAYSILGREIDSLFQNYHWKEAFFSKNAHLGKLHG